MSFGLGVVVGVALIVVLLMLALNGAFIKSLASEEDEDYPDDE